MLACSNQPEVGKRVEAIPKLVSKVALTCLKLVTLGGYCDRAGECFDLSRIRYAVLEVT